MIFRARLTRAARGAVCAILVIAAAWAVHAELTFYGIDSLLRTIALIPTLVFGAAFVVGIWRLWVVCLIVDENGATVRNFRGDLRFRRREIREVYAVTDFTGCHVALRLKVGDEIHLDGLAFASPGRTNRAVAEISQALRLGLVSSPDEP
ncbi:MAG TPA: hypothetical protein VHC43_16900 [Mycobacteriales bacterium]|nr:hypothetical protein [Mycobacteriales bacterium]